MILSPELDSGNRRLLTLSPVLGMFALPTIPTVRTIFKDAALREPCVVETEWYIKLNPGEVSI